MENAIFFLFFFFILNTEADDFCWKYWFFIFFFIHTMRQLHCRLYGKICLITVNWFAINYNIFGNVFAQFAGFVWITDTTVGFVWGADFLLAEKGRGRGELTFNNLDNCVPFSDFHSQNMFYLSHSWIDNFVYILFVSR